MGRPDCPALRVGLIGTTRLTHRLFEFLDSRAEVAFVVGLPDDQLPAKADAIPMDSACNQRDIPLLKPRSLQEAVAYIKDFPPDLIVEFGDSRIVPEEILALPRLGVVGNHGATLPDVKGAASLSWGRMFDLGSWGISIFYLTPAIDEGGIIATARFTYPKGCSMRQFVNLANERTEALLEDSFARLCNGAVETRANPSAEVRVAEGTDAFDVKSLFLEAMAKGKGIYLPRRRPADAEVKPHWPEEFVEAFKAANNDPYPKWF